MATSEILGALERSCLVLGKFFGSDEKLNFLTFLATTTKNLSLYKSGNDHKSFATDSYSQELGAVDEIIQINMYY